MTSEQRILALGTELIERTMKHAPKKGSDEWLNHALFDLCMNDPFTRMQVLRFIDVLPSLHGDKDIVDHLKEYLLQEHVDLSFLKFGVHAAGFASKISPKLVVPAIKASVTRIGRTFISGGTVEEIVPKLEKSMTEGKSFSLDLLGEKTTSHAAADAYMNGFLHILDILAKRFGKNMLDKNGKPLLNVSIKLSSLSYMFDPVDPEGTKNSVKQRLRPILKKAQEYGAFVYFDAEHYHIIDIIYEIFKELMQNEYKNFYHTGLVVQAYLKDSEKKVRDIIAWSKKNSHPLSVRLVKGAYWDYEIALAQKNHWPIPVFTNKAQTDANFEKLTELLMEHHALTHPAIGSHNIRSMAYALAAQEHYAVPNTHFEIQMLYGMGTDIQSALCEKNIPLRVYTPFGELIPGMGYLVRRLLENSSNQSFLRAFDARTPPSTLLKNPSLEIKEATLPYALSSKSFTNVPLFDFSLKETRDAMDKALEKIHASFGKITYGLKIGKSLITTKETIPSRNPSHHREIIGTVAQARKEHLDLAITEAKKAFASWRDISPEKRAQYLFTTAQKMCERFYELSALMVYEAGKTRKEACADVAEAIDFLNFYAHEMVRLGTIQKTQELLSEENTMRYVPKGVVTVISPWNFPLAILTGMASAALVAGNTVIMKPSSDTPLIGAELMKLFEAAGLPSGVLNYLPGSGEGIGMGLVESPDIAMVAFTGSRDVGLTIYQKIAQPFAQQQHVKTTVLEMGGKNAVIVDSSADLDEVIPGVLYSAFGYQGQKCSACSRLIVVEPVYDRLVERLIESTKSLTVGEAHVQGTDVAAVINKNAYDRIRAAIAQAKKDGGKILLEGHCSDENGYFIGPTIIETTRKSPLAQEEIFGPVLAVIKVKDFDEALAVFNETAYALTGGIYTRTPSHIERFKREALVGNRYINRGITGAVVERQPFGGFKLSGAGSKAGGKDYLLNFMYSVSTAENVERKGHVPGL